MKKLKKLTTPEFLSLKEKDVVYNSKGIPLIFKQWKTFNKTKLAEFENSTELYSGYDLYKDVLNYKDSFRDFIGEMDTLDGRQIMYRISTAHDYLLSKGIIRSEDEWEDFVENNLTVADLINQIIGLKQSCYILRHTSYLCGSVSDSLYYLKESLIKKLKEEYDFDFDDDFVENY